MEFSKERLEEVDITGGFNPYQVSWGEEIEFPTTRKMSEFGNRIYNRYPARSIFLVPRAILHQHLNQGLKVLDPFMGSGTTAVETILSGNYSYGTEMDPFAQLIANVSTTIFTREELSELKEVEKTILTSWEEFPASKLPHLRGITHWFKEEDLIKLLRLKTCIKKICPKKYQPFIMIAYADCIRPVSLIERQSSKPYISKKHPKVTKEVKDSFIYSFEAHYKAINAMSSQKNYKKYPSIKWLGYDATDFKLKEPIIDIAISSPPYINALDYARCVKIEGSFCDLIDNNEVINLNHLQLGHESRRKQDKNELVRNIFKEYYNQIFKKDKNRAETCLAYFNDMYKNLLCVYNSLRNEGEYHIIIGDNIIKEVNIPTHELIAEIAKSIGFDWFGYYKYPIKDHRTSIPRDHKENKIKYEHVIMLRKK